MNQVNPTAPANPYNQFVEDGDVQNFVSVLKFGLNEEVYLTKFEFNPNGGKEGAAQECVDIEFTFHKDGENTNVSYRQFPVTKAMHNNQPITDPTHEAFQKEVSSLLRKFSHILGCFVDNETIKTAIQSSPVNSFRELVMRYASLLPQGFQTQKLHAFCHYEWSLRGDNKMTYLRLQGKRKHGAFLCKAIEAQGGPWTERRTPATDANGIALSYVDGSGNIHPFTRTGWFMDSPFASQQRAQEFNSPATANAGGTFNPAPPSENSPW